ncbi:hypothetical protein ACRAR1_05025 [Streptomyces sanyensis]|uniref:hypothetical protein n=1 Tax=Streptomyces sanyensis TaxID=568869 RepID=UPI003D783BAE
MEQRIDPNAKPEFAAGTDPSFVPLVGLAQSPVPAAGAAEEDRTGAANHGEPGADEEWEAGGPEGTAARDGGEADGADEAHDEAREPHDGSGPSFEARDRRGSVTADGGGIVFRLDDQEADFRWDEVRAVEVRLPRFGRRFTVVVHVAANRWFTNEVEADRRGRLKEWEAGLDAVLDAYFEE